MSVVILLVRGMQNCGGNHVQSPLPFKAIQQTVILPPNLILNQNTNQSINQSILKNKLPVWCVKLKQLS